MQKLKLILFFCLIIICAAFTKTSGNEKVQWLQLHEVTAKLKDKDKPILIDLYTDWCYWCKVMDKKTYNNKKVIEYINEHFYSARINAETKDILNWKDKTYNYNDTYHINNFSLFVTYGRASFPTTVIIADQNSAPIPIAGFMEPKELERILKYFGEGAYKTMNFPQFEKTFRSSW